MYQDKVIIEPLVSAKMYDRYLRAVNELRSCETSLGMKDHAFNCDLIINNKKAISEKYFIREPVLTMRERDGQCVKTSRSGLQTIYNDQNQAVVYSSENGAWSFIKEDAIPCLSNGRSKATTGRVLMLGGHIPDSSKSKGYFQVIDWGIPESAFPNSRSRAEQIQMGADTTLTIRGDDNLLKFEYSNGAYIYFDSYTQAFTDSNFLGLDHFTPEKCVTDETQEGSGTVTERARFAPKLKLTAPYKKLPIEVIQK